MYQALYHRWRHDELEPVTKEERVLINKLFENAIARRHLFLHGVSDANSHAD